MWLPLLGIVLILKEVIFCDSALFQVNSWKNRLYNIHITHFVGGPLVTNMPFPNHYVQRNLTTDIFKIFLIAWLLDCLSLIKKLRWECWIYNKIPNTKPNYSTVMKRAIKCRNLSFFNTSGFASLSWTLSVKQSVRHFTAHAVNFWLITVYLVVLLLYM